MKRFDKASLLTLAAFGLAALSSCSSYYYETTRIRRGMEGQRTVYSTNADYFFQPDSSWVAAEGFAPFAVDFYTRFDTMRRATTRPFAHLADLQHPSANALSHEGVESVRRRFRWFVTYYDYSVRYPRLTFPSTSLDDYLSPEEQRLLFRGAPTPADWNGLEQLEVLDRIGNKYARWQSDLLFNAYFDAMLRNVDDDRRQALLSRRDTLCNAFDIEQMFGEGSLLQRLEEQSGVPFSEEELQRIEQEVDETEWLATLDETFSVSVLRRIELPGHLVRPAAARGTTAYTFKVDGSRLLQDDLEVCVTSRAINWLSFPATIVLLLIPFCLVRRRRRRRRY